MNTNSKKGFTLLEFLIIVAVIAILASIVFVVLNPAETLKKTRDAQRISDLNTIKNVLRLYLTTKTSPTLGNAGANITCQDSAGAYADGDKIWYSLPNTSPITDTTLDGGTNSPAANQVTTPSLVTGLGWVPVDLTSLAGETPLSNYPVDPTNAIANPAAVASTDLVYRYTCDATNLTFELDAQLESTAYTVTDDKRTSDGGNNPNYFEVGTAVDLLGTGTDF